jgi:hypothetical protein
MAREEYAPGDPRRDSHVLGLVSDYGVVVLIIFLFPFSIVEAKLLREIFAILAKKHPTRKFMTIVATSCVENFQDVDVPCLLFYKNGELINQLSGIECR